MLYAKKQAEWKSSEECDRLKEEKAKKRRMDRKAERQKKRLVEDAERQSLSGVNRVMQNANVTIAPLLKCGNYCTPRKS